MISNTYFITIDAKMIFLNTDVTVNASNLARGLSIPAKVDINPFLLGRVIGMSFNFQLIINKKTPPARVVFFTNPNLNLT